MLCVVYVCMERLMNNYVSNSNNYYDVCITMALIKYDTGRVDQ